MRKIILLQLLIVYFSGNLAFAQCCGGGSAFSGNIADPGSQGVLPKEKFEVSSYYHYMYTDKLKTNDFKIIDTLSPGSNFKEYIENYLYTRIGYGISEKLTIMVEIGYFINKIERQIDGTELSGKGIGDLVIFPRYNLLNIKNKKHVTDLTLGLGMKIPIGEYEQTYVAYLNPINGKEFILVKSPSTQPGTGTNDLIFNLFFGRNYSKSQLSFATSFTYILAGTNPLGHNFGNIAKLSMFASKPLTYNLNLTAQLKAESVDTLRDLYGIYKNNTGFKKVFFIPQVSYTIFDKLTVVTSIELPLYQYVNGTQLATKLFFSGGIIYKFYLKKNTSPKMLEGKNDE